MTGCACVWDPQLCPTRDREEMGEAASVGGGDVETHITQRFTGQTLARV